MTDAEREKAQLAHDSLKDILGAAENGQPYSFEELSQPGFALDAYNGLVELLGIEEE